MTLYSYIIADDYGLAPNPFWGRMTLTVCKPLIRKNAKVGDWIIGTGSNEVLRPNKSTTNFSGKLVFIMQVSEVMTMMEYNNYCLSSKTEMKNKIPKKNLSWKNKVGDCIYKYPIKGDTPILRPGLHCKKNIKTDLDGKNALLSDNFYYFGENAVEIDQQFRTLIKDEQGHKKCVDLILIEKFLNWFTGLNFKKNSINGDPQLKDIIDWNFYNEPDNVKGVKIYRLS